jgi:hypothetical protein
MGLGIDLEHSPDFQTSQFEAEALPKEGLSRPVKNLPRHGPFSQRISQLVIEAQKRPRLQDAGCF